MSDPGLQPERTVLAWRRTALGLLANAALLIASGVRDSPVRVGLGVLVAVSALVAWGVVTSVYRTGAAAPQGLGTHRVMRSAAVLVIVVGVADLYAVLTH